MPTPCPFCSLPPTRIHASTAHTHTLRDAYPVSPGHTLVIPKRHVADYFDTTPQEQADLWASVALAKAQLDATLQPKPDAYNVGINAGVAAGQTVMHVHIHVIPRYDGDVADPRGGVRGVIATKQKY